MKKHYTLALLIISLLCTACIKVNQSKKVETSENKEQAEPAVEPFEMDRLALNYSVNGKERQYSVIIFDTPMSVNKDFFPATDTDFEDIQIIDAGNHYTIFYEYTSTRPRYYLNLHFAKTDLQLDSIEEGVFVMDDKEIYKIRRFYKGIDFADTLNIHNTSINVNNEISLEKILKTKR